MKRFDLEWWNSFAHSTQGLEEARLFKDVLDTNLNGVACDFFYGLQQNEEILVQALPNVRIYLNGGYRKDLALKFLKFPLARGESLYSWCNRFFKDEKFLISFSDFSVVSNRITEEFTRFLIPFFEIFGIPRFTHLTFFIGNYNYTPFGVHIDLKGLKAIHFHLGPGRKEMHLWTPEQLKGLNLQTVEFMNPAELIERSSKKYVIEAGDIFYFPVDKYFHIGCNLDEFSVAISLGINNTSFKEILSKHLTNLIASEMTIDELLPSRSILQGDSPVHFTRLEEILKFDHEVISKIYSKIKSDFLSKLSSYGFSPIQEPLGKPVDIRLDSKFRVVDPFKILYETENFELKLYARNRLFKLQNDELITSLIDRINSSDEFEVKTEATALIEKYGEKNVITLFEFLNQARILTKIN